MPPILRNCCVWDSCRKAIFTRRRNGRCGTSLASGCNRCSAGPPRSWRSRTCSHARQVGKCRAKGKRSASSRSDSWERVKLHPDYALLNSVPGIGPVLATTIMPETGTISRFAKVGNFSSYCRCVDSRARKQQQEERSWQHEERQQVSGMGICRGGQLRHPLVPGSQALLRAQETRAKWDRHDQGAGAQAGARLLSPASGAQVI